jgi:hypothetical protein
VIVAPTRAEANDILEDYARHVDQEGQLALLSGWTGIDFSTYRPDQAVQYVESNAIQSMVKNFTVRNHRPVKIGDLATLSRVGARSPFVVGSPQDVADELIAWADETDVDGFNLFRLVVPESLNAFVDLVVPELQSRGVYKTAYSEGTLRKSCSRDEGRPCTIRTRAQISGTGPYRGEHGSIRRRRIARAWKRYSVQMPRKVLRPLLTRSRYSCP